MLEEEGEQKKGREKERFQCLKAFVGQSICEISAILNRNGHYRNQWMAHKCVTDTKCERERKRETERHPYRVGGVEVNVEKLDGFVYEPKALF